MVPLIFWQVDVRKKKKLDKLIDMQHQRVFGHKQCYTREDLDTNHALSNLVYKDVTTF